MRRLMSLPLVRSVLAEYPGDELERSCRAHGCDGLEVVWGGEDLPADIPPALHVGYHLTFWPDWLDFWRGDSAALVRKFGSEAACAAFYGGPPGRDTLLSAYRADLARAAAWGAKYVVFHVSDVSIEEGYTYRWEHSHEEVADTAAECVNLLLDGRDWPFALLVENQWWPGFTFTDPSLTRRLMDGIHYENKGIMLDTGHLMNADPGIGSQAEGAAFIHRMLDEHGALCRYIRGMHLHQSVSGAYVKAHTGALPPDLPEEYLARFGVSYGHILQIDRHQPWSCPEIASVVRRISPEFLVHELSAESRAEREARLDIQNRCLER